MKTIGKILLWILGIIAWFFLLIIFQMADMTHGTPSHLILLIITGILLAIYLWRGKSPGTSTLEKEIQELKAENQRLRQELEVEQAARHAMEKTENREGR